MSSGEPSHVKPHEEKLMKNKDDEVAQVIISNLLLLFVVYTICLTYEAINENSQLTIEKLLVII